MDCELIPALISSRLDGELPTPRREWLESHLAECESCRVLAGDLTAQDRTLRLAFTARRPQVTAVIEKTRVRLENHTAPRCSVLVVDDEAVIRSLLTATLSRDYDVRVAPDADEAQRILEAAPVDILLTDQRMPRRTGVQLLEWTREHRPQTIRLLMTGYGELGDAVAAINQGNVYHYIPKPWRQEDLFQVMRNAADKFHLERKRERYLGELWHLNRELERRVAERTQELEEANLLLEQRARELERLALTDPLTGLLNRRAIDELARFELKRHDRYPSPLTIGYVDVDHFKAVNTDHLLTGGDEVLRALARILSSSVREVDSVGRVGGEEFLVVARETGTEGATKLAERIRQNVSQTPIIYNGVAIPITVSVGFAVAEADVPADFEPMLNLAAAALAHAKANGRNRAEVRRLPQAKAG